MSSLHTIKKRLTGTRNIHQMTSAMELVSATKMRRAQETALSARFYSVTGLEILGNSIEYLKKTNSTFNITQLPLLMNREIKKTAVIVITSDRGMAGSLNAAVLKKVDAFLIEQCNSTKAEVIEKKFIFIIIGKKGYEYAKRRNYPIASSFDHIADATSPEKIIPIAEQIEEGFLNGSWDKVIAFSTTFVSALSQEVHKYNILPLEEESVRQAVEDILPEKGKYFELKKKIKDERPIHAIDYLIEPSPEQVLKNLFPLLFQMYLYHIVLEANASEHSARRAAMKNAADNARELIDSLVLSFNRTRQADITKELTEITSTVSAME